MSLLHAHLVFVTKYRRPVFTDEMLSFCEHTMRAVCAELDAELVEFNGEADHVHLLIAYPPTLYTRDGRLPAGVTFFGRAWDETTLISLAYSYEQHTKHRRPPASAPPLSAK